MRIMKSKKATILYYIVITGFFVGLVIFYVNSLYSKLEDQPDYIGQIQFSYLEAAQQAENSLFYADQSAKYSIYDSLFTLGENGGLYVSSRCGDYKGYLLWQALDISDGKKQIKNCYPTEIKDDFSHLLRYNMEEFARMYTPNFGEGKFYADNYDFVVEGNLKVTGLATIPIYTPIYYQPEKDSIGALIGEYAVKPSFVQEVDYDLDVYELIKTQAITINTLCADATDLMACVREEASKIEGWGVDFCPRFPKEEKECLDKNKALAAGELPYVPWFGKSWGSWDENVFKRCDRCPAAGAKCGDYKDENYCMLDPCNIGCIWETDKCEELTQEKKDKINDARLFGFCVLGDKSFPYYNLVEDRIEKKPVAIKFAMYIEDLPPPPVEGLFVDDNKAAEHSVVMRWKKSAAEDVSKYIIYYSTSKFKDKPMEEIKPDKAVLKKEINYDEASLLAFDKIDIDDCELKMVKIRNREEIMCLFDGNKVLEVNRLYYIRETGELVYILDSSDIKEGSYYYIAVTAVDKGNNEINNKDIGQKLNVAGGESEDDLGPGLIDFEVTLEGGKELVFKWPEVTTNIISDYTLADLSSYSLYYKGCEFPKVMPSDNRESMAGTTSIKLSANLPHCVPGSDTYSYYFFVLAEDKSGNPDIDLDKLKELGLVVKEVSITDKKDGTFSRNSVNNRKSQSPAVEVDYGESYKTSKKTQPIS